LGILRNVQLTFNFSSFLAAITQLFRLPASTTGTSNTQPSTTTQAAEISAALQPLISAYPELSTLQSILEAQQLEIAEAVAKIESSTRYRHLGKPIGGTLIALALVFLFIGSFSSSFLLSVWLCPGLTSSFLQVHIDTLLFKRHS
jgi:hypothetical protein